MPAQPQPPRLEGAPLVVDFGVAGASARRLFDAKEAKRRERLRSRWWVVALIGVLGAIAGGFVAHSLQMSVTGGAVIGAALPVFDVLRRPQHIDAWRSGAAGERAVGAMLDQLRVRGVVAIHDRRVPGRRTNIDHIAIAPTGVFVIDTKNVAGKVVASRNALRVAGRRQDKMLAGVTSQVTVVQQILDGLQGVPAPARGVLCFTKAGLPWFRPQPCGVTLEYRRGLRRLLTKGDPLLSRDQVNTIATQLAIHLPAA